MTQRIDALDGFRAVAVLGVLWAHIWMFLGNPSLIIFKLNVAAGISFFGTGVDLFFVISGFCMYLMYVTKNKAFTIGSYFQYLKKRWLRIAPTFYFAAFIYGLYEVNFSLSKFSWNYWFKLILFVRNLFDEKTQYGPHFWSLGTEWHFYLLLPFIIAFLSRSFKASATIILLLCLAIRFIFWIHPNDAFSIINYSIFNRLIEFMMGVIAAGLYLNNSSGWYCRSYWGIVVGILLAGVGRVLMTVGFHYREDSLGIAARVFDLPLLTMGYALLIVNTLSHPSIVKSFLETKFMSLIGKYSYSMYLWHWIISGIVVNQLRDLLTISPFINVNALFVLSVIVLLLVSFISYILFERFYFLTKN